MLENIDMRVQFYFRNNIFVIIVNDVIVIKKYIEEKINEMKVLECVGKVLECVGCREGDSGGRYNFLQTDSKDLVISNQNVIVFTIFRLNMNRTRYDNVDDLKIKNNWGREGMRRE